MDDDFVTETLCKERCDGIKKVSKLADKNQEDWLKSLDARLWAVIVITIMSLLSSVGALLMLLLNGGGKG